MINYFYNDYSDDYENFYFGEKRNNLNYFGEDNELDNPIPNEEFREDKPLLYDYSGFKFPPSLFNNNSNSNRGNNTEPTSEDKQNELLNQKRKREEIIIKKEKKEKEKENKNEIILVQENRNEENLGENILGLEEDDNIEKVKKQNKKNFGRRKKDENYNNDADHNKFKEDNIIRKIKTSSFRYILNKLNDSLDDTSLKFCPINADINENLKKDFNEELLGRTICDIYMNSDSNKRYQTKSYSNKILIEKILMEKTEKKTIEILNLTFHDILKIIREKDREKFLKEIREKEEKNAKNKIPCIDEYMRLLDGMLDDYENWFYKKKGRNVNRKNKK